MDNVYTTHDAGKILQVHPYTVSKWMDAGKLKSWRTAGGHRRVSGSDLRAYLLEHGLPVPPELLQADSRLRLLVVDDEPIALRAIARAFKPLASEVVVTATTSGIDALLLLGDVKPDGMLIDINMPDLDGYEVCRRVRTHPSFDGVVLIAITAHHTGEVAAEALKAGAIACLAKPFAVEQVLGFVRRARAEDELRKNAAWQREKRARLSGGIGRQALR